MRAASNFLKMQGLGPGAYDQMASYAVTQTGINIAIGDKPPSVCFDEVKNQCDGGAKKYGGITSMADFKVVAPAWPSLGGPVSESMRAPLINERGIEPSPPGLM